MNESQFAQMAGHMTAHEIAEATGYSGGQINKLAERLGIYPVFQCCFCGERKDRALFVNYKRCRACDEKIRREEAPEGKKHCAKCGETKPLTEWYITKQRALMAYCKTCTLELSRERKAHRDEGDSVPDVPAHMPATQDGGRLCYWAQP